MCNFLVAFRTEQNQSLFNLIVLIASLAGSVLSGVAVLFGFVEQFFSPKLDAGVKEEVLKHSS
jgi:hypothetical protein